MSAPGPFSAAHRRTVQTLYKRALKQSLDWYIFRDLWRQRAIEIRARFEANRDIQNPRRVQAIIEAAEKELYETRHPDPYLNPTQVDGTKFQRNLHPPTTPPVELDI